MIIITDSNIIVSALISPNGSPASIFKEKSNLQFIAPDYMLEEVMNHWNIIVKYSLLSLRELFEELNYYKTRITFIKTKNIPSNIAKEAYKIVKDIDGDDADFVALHLYQKHKLWTGDKKLISGLLAKGYDICITTAELREKLYKRNKLGNKRLKF